MSAFECFLEYFSKKYENTHSNMLFLKFCAQLGSVRPKSLFLCARYRFFVVDFALFDELMCFFTHQLVF